MVISLFHKHLLSIARLVGLRATFGCLPTCGTAPTQLFLLLHRQLRDSLEIGHPLVQFVRLGVAQPGCFLRLVLCFPLKPGAASAFVLPRGAIRPA